MKKSLLSLSLVASIMLVSGCGGSDDGGTDTVAPKFLNTTYEFTLNEGEKQVVELKTDDATATFSGPGVSGNILTYIAPEVNTDMLYTVPVTVTDGTNSVNHDFKFTVKDTDIITASYSADATYIAPDSGASLTADGKYFKDASGLLWKDTITQPVSYTVAESICVGDWRVPTRDEFLNLMDYTSGDGTGSKTLIRSELTNIVAANPDTSWVLKSGTDLFVVNHKGGVDTTIDTDKNSTVVCVHGTPAAVHTFVEDNGNVKDNTTGLVWRKIDPATSNTGGSASYGDFAFAQTYCASPWRLPTINELRSVRDGDSISSLIAPSTPTNLYNVWSSTSYTNGDVNIHYMMDLREKAVILTDDDNVTHYVTCVQ